MNEDRQVLINLNSNLLDNGVARQPQPENIEYGEFALNYKKGYETLFIKNDNDEIVSMKFAQEEGSGIQPLYAPTWFTEESDERPFNDKNEIYDYIRRCKTQERELYTRKNDHDVRLAVVSDIEHNLIGYLITGNVPVYDSLVDSERMTKKRKQTKYYPSGNKKMVVRRGLPYNPNWQLPYFFQGPILTQKFKIKRNSSIVFRLREGDRLSKFNNVDILSYGWNGIKNNNTYVKEISAPDQDRYYTITFTNITNEDIYPVFILTYSYQGKNTQSVVINIGGNYQVSYMTDGIRLVDLTKLKVNGGPKIGKSAEGAYNIFEETTTPFIKYREGRLVCTLESTSKHIAGWGGVPEFTGDTIFDLNRGNDKMNILEFFRKLYKNRYELYYKSNRNNKTRYNTQVKENMDDSLPTSFLYVGKDKGSVYVGLLDTDDTSSEFEVTLNFVFQMLGGNQFAVLVPMKFNDSTTHNKFFEFGYEYVKRQIPEEFFTFGKIVGVRVFEGPDDRNVVLINNYIRNNKKKKWKKVKGYGARNSGGPWPREAVGNVRINILKSLKDNVGIAGRRTNPLDRKIKKCTFKFISKHRGVRCQPSYITVINKKEAIDTGNINEW